MMFMNLNKAIELYQSVGERNANYLFRWISKVYDKLYLPCIDSGFRKNLVLDKTKLTIFDVLVDDLADNFQMRNEKLLGQFIRIPWNNTAKYSNAYLETGRKIWTSCINSIKKYPRFQEFKSMFYFDLMQVMNSMQYSFLVNTIGMDNQTENRRYLPHGCMVVLHCDMDLMCSPEFDVAELGAIREVFLLAQKIVHYGNMLSTYPREIKEKDFSSPIISYAVRNGLVKQGNMPSEKILREVEKIFIDEAHDARDQMLSFAQNIKSVDVTKVVEGYFNVFQSFLKRDRYWEEKH